jgi:hypothetical protein
MDVVVHFPGKGQIADSIGVRLYVTTQRGEAVVARGGVEVCWKGHTTPF